MRTGPAAYGAALGCGLLVALGQVPLSLWPLALAGLSGALWLVAQRGSARRAAALALAFGVGHFGLALHWITEPFQVDAARDGWMAPFALVFLATGLAGFWALAGWLSARWFPAGGMWRAVAFAAALLAVEMLRGHVLTGFPWVLLGHVWLGHAPEQAAALVGAYGLTLLTLALALGPLAGARGALAAAALLGALWGHGLWRAGQPVPAAQGAVVRLVQPDAAQSEKWIPARAREFFFRQIDFTAAPAARRPDMILWPETAVSFLLDDPGRGLELIAEAAAGVPVVLGIQRLDGWRGYNSLAVLGADGQVAAVYDKHHLVPFGEYMPLGDLLADWFGIAAFAAREGNGYSAGPGPAVLDFAAMGIAGFGSAVPLICYEAVFPQDIRRAARPGWLLQLTNDAWFGDRAGPYQHLSLARLRAIEFGLPLVRAANTGVSAVIDARGQVVSALGLNRAGWIDAALPAALPPTPYARAGEWPLLVALALLAALLAAARRRLGIDHADGGR